MSDDATRPAGPPAGWYPSQTDPTTDVYWDGSAWTGQARQANRPPNSPGVNPETGTLRYAWGTGEYAGKYWDGKRWVTPSRGLTPPETSPATTPKEPKERKPKTVLSIVLGLAVAVVVVVAIASFLTKDDAKTAAQSKPQANAVASTDPELTGRCTRYQELVNGAKTEKEALVTIDNGRLIGCDLQMPDKTFPTKAAPLPMTGPAKPTLEGVEYKWVDNPKCDYGGCMQLRVTPRVQSCTGGLYVAVNVLDSSGTIIGYSNDLLPSVALGQQALLTFPILEDAADSVQIAEVKCY